MAARKKDAQISKQQAQYVIERATPKMNESP